MIGKLKANNTFLDLSDGIPLPFNYSIADAKKPESRKRNFSKELLLPGTENNLNFFSSSYLLALTTLDNTTTVGFNFDPTIRIPAKYYSESGELVFDGLLRLNEVLIENSVYTFKCTMFSNFIDLFLQLGNIKVNELGWSEYNHALTRTNVINSFATSVMLNGVNTSNMSGGNPLGWGYHYGMVNYGYSQVAPSTLKINDLVPMVYWKEVVEKCLKIAGLKYSSNYFNSTLFKKFLLGFGGGEKISLPAQEILNRRCAFTMGYEKTYYAQPYNQDEERRRFYSNVWDVMIAEFDGAYTTGVTTDIYLQFENDVIQIEKEGLYNINASFPLLVQFIDIPAYYSYDSGVITHTFRMIKNGQTYSEIVSTQEDLSNYSETLSFDLNIQCNEGDTIEFIHQVLMDIWISAPTVYHDTSIPIGVSISLTDDIDIDLTCVQASLQTDDIVDISRFIPDMKASDFLAGVFTASNLYISDPDYTNTVKIEPLNDFYKPTTSFIDISHLVDYSKPINIIPSSSIEGKFYKFNWLEDNDYENKSYRDTFGLGYGNHTFVVPSTFQKGDKVYQLPFAQSIPTDKTYPFIRPSIISYDVNTNVVKPYKGKPRVYIWNGLKSGSWRLTDTDGILNNDLSTYPCVHHFDNYENPTFDLNFGLPLKLEYNATYVTTDNLFNRHHKKFIKEITGRDSKIVRLFIRINSAFIQDLDFSNNIMWDGVLYRLNEIKDWDENITESTQIELIRIISASNKAGRQRPSLPQIGELNKYESPITTGTDVNILYGGFNEVTEYSRIIRG